MRYFKPFLRASFDGLKAFGVIYLVVGILDKKSLPLLLLYYSFVIGCAGIIGESLNITFKKGKSHD